MALSICWTAQASVGFNEIVEYLELHFAEIEIRNVISDVDNYLELPRIYPGLLAGSATKPDVHPGPINKYTMLEALDINAVLCRIELRRESFLLR
jgi:hypothetical protein